MIVGSGGGGVAFATRSFVWLISWEEIEPGEASFLCVRKRVVRVCWRAETRPKGVVLGRWRWASLILAGGGCTMGFWNLFNSWETIAFVVHCSEVVRSFPRSCEVNRCGEAGSSGAPISDLRRRVWVGSNRTPSSERIL